MLKCLPMLKYLIMPKCLIRSEYSVTHIPSLPQTQKLTSFDGLEPRGVGTPSSQAPLPLLENDPQLLHAHRECVPALVQEATPVFPRGEPDVEAGDEEGDHGPHFHLRKLFADAAVGTC